MLLGGTSEKTYKIGNCEVPFFFSFFKKNIPSLFLLPPTWNPDVIVGVPASISAHEVTFRMKASG